jgi:putative membrane protein
MTMRWAERLLAEGTAPDPRFTFANERTFLAWIRTALAVIAGGIGLEALLADVLPDVVRRGLAALLIMLGGALATTSFTRWLANERALRNRRPLPPPGVAPVLAGGIGVVALSLLGFVLLRG